MSIQAKCPNPACGKVLTVKDEHAGKSGKCPACGGVVAIPGRSMTTGPATARAHPIVTATSGRNPGGKNPPQATEGFVHIPCPACRNRLKLLRKLLGKEMKCPSCGIIFIAAEEAAGSSPAAREEGIWLDPKKTPKTPSRNSRYEDYEPPEDDYRESREGEEAPAQKRACPYCGERILAVAKKCRYCGEWLEKSSQIKRFSVPIAVVPVWKIPFFVVLSLELYWLFWLYRIFKELHAREFTIITPGSAVGRLFIPIYNLFWIFAVFAELQKAITRAYEFHHQPLPSTGWTWVMPAVWLPGQILTLATGGAGIPFTMTGASVTLCCVQSWMNYLAVVETGEDVNRRS